MPSITGQNSAHHSALLSPPFSRETSLPCTACAHIAVRSSQISERGKGLSAYLDANLQTPRVNILHAYLWLAGLPRQARPLHRQRILQRTICLTEAPNEHLVWHDARIFIKPLPAFLLDYDFWNRSLCRDGDADRHASACGLLLSYTWLVAHPSDLRIALDTGLLPPDVTWDAWTALAADFLDRVDIQSFRGIDSRYEYGELRLSRLNALYRLGFAGSSLRHVVFGFMSQPGRYNTFFERNFSWIVVAFVYVTVVLSAMQVALGTERLSSDVHFQQFSYSFAIVSLSFVALALAVMGTVWVSLFSYHLLSTRHYCKKTELYRRVAYS